jgi:hypothetical protein
MTFRKLDLFPFSGEGGEKTPTQLGPLERANLNHWAQLSRCLLPHLHLRTETDPVSETSCFLENRMMEKVQKNSVNSVQHTPSSESFQVLRTQLYICFLCLFFGLFICFLFPPPLSRNYKHKIKSVERIGCIKLKTIVSVWQAKEISFVGLVKRQTH